MKFLKPKKLYIYYRLVHIDTWTSAKKLVPAKKQFGIFRLIFLIFNWRGVWNRIDDLKSLKSRKRYMRNKNGLFEEYFTLLSVVYSLKNLFDLIDRILCTDFT